MARMVFFIGLISCSGGFCPKFFGYLRWNNYDHAVGDDREHTVIHYALADNVGLGDQNAIVVVFGLKRAHCPWIGRRKFIKTQRPSFHQVADFGKMHLADERWVHSDNPNGVSTTLALVS